MTIKQKLVTFGLFVASFAASWLLYEVAGMPKYLVVAGLFLGMYALARFLGLNPKDIGLSRDKLLSGIRFVLPLVFTLVVLFGLIFAIDSGIFLDERYDIAALELFVKLFLILPFTTVLLEELFFRGIMLGYLQKHTRLRTAILLSSLTFGLWHVFIARSASVPQLDIPFAGQITTLGTVVITSGAGAIFAWLKVRTGSLAAPILIHWTINACGVVFAFAAWR